MADVIIWTHDSAPLLWMSFVGLLGSGGLTDATAEGKWFMVVFQTTAKQYRQQQFSDTGTLGKMLSTFPWSKTYCQPLLDGLERGFDLVRSPS
jgi:hypothetical protein